MLQHRKSVSVLCEINLALKFLILRTAFGIGFYSSRSKFIFLVFHRGYLHFIILGCFYYLQYYFPHSIFINKKSYGCKLSTVGINLFDDKSYLFSIFFCQYKKHIHNTVYTLYIVPLLVYHLRYKLQPFDYQSTFPKVIFPLLPLERSNFGSNILQEV